MFSSWAKIVCNHLNKFSIFVQNLNNREKKQIVANNT